MKYGGGVPLIGAKSNSPDPFELLQESFDCARVTSHDFIKFQFKANLKNGVNKS